jgi:hypothetical protein
MKLHWAVIVAVVAFLVSLGRVASAGSVSKDECIEAHGRGQDLRERGQLTRAKQTFLMCAQSSCPALVQGDCARFGEELAHIVPTIGFGARDKAANDLPNTTVYVDDALVATRLDDGKSYEVDPGRHTLRFVNAGREQTLHVIVNQGEKSRLFVARFLDAESPARESDALATSNGAQPSKSKLPLVVAGLGLAAAVTGGVLTGIGFAGIPTNCSSSTHECAAPPGDHSIARAQDAMTMADVGITTLSVGVVALVSGVVWYVLDPFSPKKNASGFDPAIRF